jgi:replicative DNA helicase
VTNYTPTLYEHISAGLTDALTDILVPAPSVKILQMPAFSKLTGGLRPNEFTILCGSTGTGKTTLLANWSDSLVTQEVPHFVASVETGRHDFIRRIISARIGRDWNTGDAVPLSEIKAVMTDGEMDRLRRAKLFLSLYDNRFSIETLMNDIQYMVETHGVKVCFIDNLNFFMEVTSAQQSVVEMDRVIHELIIFCKHTPVHIVMVMHPKKTLDGRVESEFDIKGSSTAVQEAQNVLLFNRPKEEFIEQGIATWGDRELLIAKMRRRGSAVGSRIILKGIDGVQYKEGALICRNKSVLNDSSTNSENASTENSPRAMSKAPSTGSTRSMMARGSRQRRDSTED